MHSLADPIGLRNYDRSLWLELAQHALLLSNGWEWALMDDICDQPMLVWKAPAWHRGSNSVYKTRQHAYNSHMKHNHPFLYPSSRE